MSGHPPPGPAGPARRSADVRRPPSRGWYVLAGLVMVAGFVGAAVTAVVLVRGADVAPTPFTAPGGTTVTADRGDTYTIFLQTRGGRAGAVGEESVPADALDCAVTDATSGEPVPLRTRDTITLTFGDREFVSRLAFDAPQDGRYEVACAHGDDPDAPVPLALGEAGAIPWLLAGLGLAFLGAVAALFAGGLIILVVALHRRRHSRVNADRLG